MLTLRVRMSEIDNGPGGISWESSSDTNGFYASYDTKESMMTDAVALFRHGIDVRFATIAEYNLAAEMEYRANG